MLYLYLAYSTTFAVSEVPQSCSVIDFPIARGAGSPLINRLSSINPSSGSSVSAQDPSGASRTPGSNIETTTETKEFKTADVPRVLPQGLSHTTEDLRQIPGGNPGVESISTVIPFTSASGGPSKIGIVGPKAPSSK